MTPSSPAFPGLDPAALSRALALVVGDSDTPTELYLERRLEVELPPAETPNGWRVRREQGLAARLTRGDRSWLATRDDLGGREMVEVLRQVARVWPSAAPEPELEPGASTIEIPSAEILAFPALLERELRRRLAAFPLRLAVRWHRRDLQVIGTRFLPPPEREAFFSLDAELPWGRCGALAPRLDTATAVSFAGRLTARFQAREAPPPPAGRTTLLLSPAACAVALHEAVAHALEADLLAVTGRPDAAIGLELGARSLDVLDDPASAPPGLERATDDEGMPVVRRWLLRSGRVEQPIADAEAARRWPSLLPGSGFRAGRHGRPLPRTHHLELLPGPESAAALARHAEEGIRVEEIDRGALDLASGRFVLHAAGGRRLRGGALAETFGRFRIAGRVADLLGGVVAIGADSESAGAGWCAKAGERRGVWARTPAIVVEGLEVLP